MFKRPTPRRRPAREVKVNSDRHLGFDYTIRYSDRRSTSIQVRDGRVLIAAPHHAPRKELQQWLQSKSGWVRGKLDVQSRHRQSIPSRSYLEGDQLPFMDTTLSIQRLPPADRRRRARAERHGNRLLVTLGGGNPGEETEQIRNAVDSWLKATAMALLSQKTHQRCKRLRVVARDIKLRKTRSKWGHCTTAGVIQYNWLILLAPEAVVDYLVVHECCHLVHHNHSAEFWSLVEQQLPGYREPRQWLRQHGHLLVL